MAEMTEQVVRKIVREETADMRDDISVLKIDVADLKIDVAELKTDVSQLKTDVAELKSDVSELKSEVTSLGVLFEDFNGKMDAVIEFIMDPIKVDREIDTRERIDRLEADMAIVKLAIRA